MSKYTRTLSALRWATLACLAALSPAVADAHVGVGPASGFGHGLWHPFMGLDHFVAMVAVGLWAAQRGGRAFWAVPLTFVSVMALGGLLGARGVSIPWVGASIVASVLILGVLIAAAIRLPLVASSLLVGLFALFHGHAHGSEMPDTAMGLAYGGGFVLATAMLHAIGMAMGVAAQRLARPMLVRYAGVAVALIGMYLYMM